GRHGGHVREISRKARRRSIYLTATYGAHPEARPTKIPAACSSIHIDEELRVRDYGVGVQAIKDVPRTTRRGPTAQEGRGESRGRRSQHTLLYTGVTQKIMQRSLRPKEDS
ncbi:hypothetical protein V1477_013199, partial [Vespula maculifrons]